MIEHKGTLVFQTERLILRPFRVEDIDSCIRNWATDPEVFTYISQYAYTAEYVSEWLSTADEAYANPETYYWAIVEKVSQEVIGEIFVDDFSSRNSWCELDWKVGKAFWGKGYATEAAKVITRFLIDEVGFYRIQSKCSIENIASERVMQKIGMKKEGVLRGYFRSKNGQYKNVVMYGLLKEDRIE